MKKMSFCTMLLPVLSYGIFLGPAHAQEKAKTKTPPAPPVTVVLLDDDIDASRLDAKKFSVKKFDELTPTTEELPPAPVRDGILARIGLQSYLAGMDELDRDLLLWNLYSYGEEMTHKKFPKIPKAVLKTASSRLDE